MVKAASSKKQKPAKKPETTTTKKKNHKNNQKETTNLKPTRKSNIFRFRLRRQQPLTRPNPKTHRPGQHSIRLLHHLPTTTVASSDNPLLAQIATILGPDNTQFETLISHLMFTG